MADTPNNGVMFDNASAAAIAQVVRTARRQQGTRDPRSPTKFADVAPFYAQLTGVSGGSYSWKKMDVITGVLTASDPVVEDTTFSAKEINGRGATVGDNVELHFAGYDDGGEAAYLFATGGTPKGQYEGQIFGDVTTLQTGFFFPSATPMV